MQPKVSLLVAMRNEAGHIEHCLESIFAQDYPKDRLEVFVLDGRSTDASWEIVERRFMGYQNRYLLSNPKTTQSAGWNLGFQVSNGDIIGIVSAHSELAPDYVSTAVATLKRTGADLVGGNMRAYGQDSVARAIALATSTPFGVGGARFHYTSKEEQVDTVYMGLCWRETYQRIGGFNEEMVRNQDDEFSYRLLKHGGRIICNPAIGSRYYNRATLRSLWRQYFQYGWWKVRVLQQHPGQMRLRQFVPPVFVATLLGSVLLSFFSPIGHALLAVVACLYLLASVAASIWAAARGGWRHLPMLPLVYAILHFGYGLGFLLGLVRFIMSWGDKQGKASEFGGKDV